MEKVSITVSGNRSDLFYPDDMESMEVLRHVSTIYIHAKTFLEDKGKLLGINLLEAAEMIKPIPNQQQEDV